MKEFGGYHGKPKKRSNILCNEVVIGDEFETNLNHIGKPLEYERGDYYSEIAFRNSIMIDEHNTIACPLLQYQTIEIINNGNKFIPIYYVFAKLLNINYEFDYLIEIFYSSHILFDSRNNKFSMVYTKCERDGSPTYLEFDFDTVKMTFNQATDISRLLGTFSKHFDIEII